jgi:hypothetical protein
MGQSLELWHGEIKAVGRNLEILVFDEALSLEVSDLGLDEARARDETWTIPRAWHDAISMGARRGYESRVHVHSRDLMLRVRTTDEEPA